jgi:uncharacterized membrane protein YhaH (DUF805 family)
MQLIHLLIGFQGRVGRGQFWLSVLIYLVFLVAVFGFAMMTGSLTAVFGSTLLALIPVFLSGVAVGVKRMHDRNKTAMWLLLFYGIPFLLFFMLPLFIDAEAETVPTIVVMLQYAGLAISLWALVELGFIRGSIGINRYGSDPVAPKPAAKH